MKLRFLKNDSLYVLKNDIKINTEHYKEKSNNWIQTATSTESNFIDFKLEVDDFNLVISSNPEKDDLENVKILYSNLKNVTDSQAGDERLWAGLCHDAFWEYMQKRWPLDKAKDKVKYIKKNYFFAHGEKRSLMTNALARLWWMGRLTYDESNIENPYELLDYLSQDFNGRGFPLFGSNFSNNRKLLKIFLYTIKEYEETNNIKYSSIEESRKKFLEMIKSMNMWSGKLLLDFINEDELRKKIINRLDYIFKKID